MPCHDMAGNEWCAVCKGSDNPDTRTFGWRPAAGNRPRLVLAGTTRIPVAEGEEGVRTEGHEQRIGQRTLISAMKSTRKNKGRYHKEK
jgi:hypothetical protein